MDTNAGVEVQPRRIWHFVPGNWKFFAVFLLPVMLAWICFLDPLDAPSSNVVEATVSSTVGSTMAATVVTTGSSLVNTSEAAESFVTVTTAAIQLSKMSTLKPTGSVKVYGNEYFCVYVMALTGFYWALDCMPLAATAFIPVIVAPLFKIQRASIFARRYMQDVGMMTFASSILVLAAISAGLSKRIAVKLIAVTAGSFRRITFYSMLVSGFLSMWLVNTAVMIFMMHVVQQVLTELGAGVGMGTLGDSRMTEWNSVNSVEANTEKNPVPEANKIPSVETVVKAQSIPPPPPDFTVEDVTKHPVEAMASLGSLVDFADELGDGEYKEVGGTDDLNEIKTDEPEGRQSFKSVLEDSAKSEEAIIVDLPDRLAELKKEHDGLLESFKLDLFHGIAIAGNIGGLFWPYGSTSSSALYYYQDLKGFENPKMFFNQGHWMTFTFPIILLVFVFACWWIDFLCFCIPKYTKSCSKASTETLSETTATTVETREQIKKGFQEKYESKGKFNSHEIQTLLVIGSAVLLFVYRRPEFISGWATAFRFVKIKDSTVACVAVVLAFVIPKCGTDMFKGPKSPTDVASFTALLGWKAVQQTFPWGILIFIGGGTALADACVQSLFNQNVVSQVVSKYGTQPWPWLVLLISILLTVLLANFVTNTAAAHIAVRILMPLSSQLGFGWCYLPVPCVVVCSFAFLLPAGTPTTALVHMKTHKLNGWACFKRGWPVALVGVFIVYVFSLFYTDKLMTCSA